MPPRGPEFGAGQAEWGSDSAKTAWLTALSPPRAHDSCDKVLHLRMAEELGTSVIEEKGTRDTVTHAALMPLSLGLVRA